MLKNTQEKLQQGESALVSRQLVVDQCSAVAITQKLMNAQKYAFLLESVTGGDNKGRYSIIAIDPDVVWQCKDSIVTLQRAGHEAETISEHGVFDSLQKLIDESYVEIPSQLPPMSAGLIGMMGYEMVREVEHLPNPKEGPEGLPDGFFMRPRLTLLLDNVHDTVTLTTPIWVSQAISAHEAEKAVHRAHEYLEDVVSKLAGGCASGVVSLPAEETLEELPFKGSMSREEYMQVVEQSKEYIRAGEVFQIVPSIRFSTEYTVSPLAFYRALRHLNPSPYLFFLKLDEHYVIGSSPEILVRVRSDEVTIRPIAGTRKRGVTESEDLALEKDLLADAKELAEHLMLLDLGRNDVGRVAKGGTVKATEKMIIERYSHVMHIVSNVTGELDKRYTALQALMAGFPAGTVTGAPKIRAIQLLDQLEPDRRGFYGGCVGYFSPNGEMDSCITLRTALIKQGQLHLQAGAGVVADSDPASEYEEVCNKARALMKAAKLARFFDC